MSRVTPCRPPGGCSSPWQKSHCIPLSDAVEIVERFTPADDGSRLDYTLRVDDRASFTQPVEFAKFWLFLPEVGVEPYECLEG